jgi:hypothetical protein
VAVLEPRIVRLPLDGQQALMTRHLTTRRCGQRQRTSSHLSSVFSMQRSPGWVRNESETQTTKRTDDVSGRSPVRVWNVARR